jgi:hypothetical protein
MQIGGQAKWARVEGVGYRRSSPYRPEAGSLPGPLKAEAVPFAPPPGLDTTGYVDGLLSALFNWK